VFRTVEEEALTTFMDKKKAQDLEDNLRQIIIYSRGPNAWQELLKLRVDIRKKRLQEANEAKKRRDNMIEVVLISGLLILGLFGLAFLAYFLLGLKNGFK
jgi:hypothetical protein